MSFMHWLTRRVFRLPPNRDRARAAVDAELEFHFEGRVEELMAAGMARDDAVAEAHRRFGSVDRIRGQLHAIDGRARRRASLADLRESLVQDARFAVRSLARRPAFALTTIAVLSLGIGATTAMYSVIDGVLIQPLPYRDPGQLVTIYTTYPDWQGKPILGAMWDRLNTTWPAYRRLAADQRTFDGAAGFTIRDASLAVGNEGVTIMRGEATANLLAVLGTQPEVGRWFLPGEAGRGAAHVAVMSHELWATRFGGEPIIGRTLKIDEEPFTVIGILPAGFALEGNLIQNQRQSTRADVWLPFGVDEELLDPGSNSLEIVARLRHGVSLATAQAVAASVIGGEPADNVRGARVISRTEAETGQVRRPLLLLFGAVSILLLITCGNVASLFLSECAMREAELRTRAVLGAGRARLARLLLTESAVIAIGGAAVGALVGYGGYRLMLRLAPREIPHVEMVHVNLRVWLFTTLVAAVVALIAGLAPALTLTRTGNGAGAGSRVAGGRSRLQTILIGVQASMSVVLIAGALLLSRSLANQRRVNPGFSAGNVLVVRVDPPQAFRASNADYRRAYVLARDAVSAVPGVRHVTAASMPPLAGRTSTLAVAATPGSAMSGTTVSAERMVVLPDYFAALHIPLVAGRAFTDADVDGTTNVVIVSEGFARRFWPTESAVGKQLRWPRSVLTVVGVAGDVRNKSLDRAPEIAFYLPFAQTTARMAFLIETRGDPLALLPAVQRAIWAAVPGATISETHSMDELMTRALAPGRYRAALATLFAVLALALTAVGVAGLAARGVAARLPELCIRMALGATQRRAVSLVVRASLGATAIGIAMGLLVAPFTSRWLSDYLFEVAPRDVASYVATCAVTATVCVGVTLLATRRLGRADLASVLRRA